MRRGTIGLMVVMGISVTAHAALLANGDWSAGNETGWTRWYEGQYPGGSPWGSNRNWSVADSDGTNGPEGNCSFANGSGSFGWYQAVPVTVAQPTVFHVDTLWRGELGGAGWAEVMLFAMSTGATQDQIIKRLDAGAAGDIAYKKDSWGMNPPTTWGWQSAALALHPSGNGGNITISADSVVVVGLKTGSGAVGGTWTQWDNITLTPEPGAMVLLATGMLPLLLRRRRGK